MADCIIFMGKYVSSYLNLYIPISQLRGVLALMHCGHEAELANDAEDTES